LDFDDNDMYMIAAQWPRLETLRLRTDPFWVTMAGFLAILRGCRVLRNLELAFKFSTRGLDLEEFQREVEPHHCLVSLEVWGSLYNDLGGGFLFRC
jgi:hypothetical protein